MTSLSIFAPAKVNLYLHVTGRLDNNYHTLDSLVAFADIGDQIDIEPAEVFEFHIDGPYADALETLDPTSNLVVKAAQGLAKIADKTLDVCITLHKNLPVASGIGGGSADAAAAIRGLLEYWDLPECPDMRNLMTELGADVPACFHGRPARLRSIGEILDPVSLPPIPILLVNPQKACSTQDVFQHFNADFKDTLTLPPSFENLFEFLKHQNNDLHSSAVKIVPEIEDVIQTLHSQEHCPLARLSGAGATCFGLFPDENAAKKAAENISENHPGWWVEAGWLK